MLYRAVTFESWRALFGRSTVPGTVVVLEVAAPDVAAACALCRDKSKEIPKSNPLRKGVPHTFLLHTAADPDRRRTIESPFPLNVATEPDEFSESPPTSRAVPSREGRLGRDTRLVPAVAAMSCQSAGQRALAASLLENSQKLDH